MVSCPYSTHIYYLLPHMAGGANAVTRVGAEQ